MTRILLGLLLSLPLAAQAAITHRFTGTAANAVDGGSHTPTLGGTTNAGDLITCAVTQRAATDYTTITASGYTTSYGKTNSNSGTVALLTKIAAGGDADPSISSSDTAAGHTIISQCAVWAGALNTVTGIVAHSNSAENTGATSIAMPSLTVTTDNTLILAIGGKANDWNAENPIIGASDALTELGQPERTSSAQTGLVWAYRIQTTAANVTTGDVTLTENTANTQSIIVSLKPAASAPTWSVEATVTVQDTNDYTLGYTPSVASTFYAVACKKDTTAPTIAQVKAGNCTGDVAAVASVNEAVTGADTTVLGGSLTLPIHDLYAVLNNASGDSTLVTLADEMLDAPAGNQHTLLASVSATSWCNDFNTAVDPDIAAADVVKTSTATSPSAYAWTQTTTCDASYPDPNGSRQSITYDVYDTSAGDWMAGGPGTLWFNNSPPTNTVGDTYDTGEDLINGVAMADVNFAAMFIDQDEGDTVTLTSSDTGEGTGADKRPAGTTITAGVLAGTPTCTGDTAGTFTITATDEAGDTDDIAVSWTCYDQVAVPDCVAGTLSDCIAAAAALNLSVSFASQCHATVPALDVLSQDPAATTSVDPFTLVDLVVSSGTCGARRGLRLGLGLGVR